MSATATAHPTFRSRSSRIARRAGRSLAYCATLVPVALFTLATTPTGGADAAVARWRALRTGLLGAPPAATPGRRSGTVAVLGHALLRGSPLPLGTEGGFVDVVTARPSGGGRPRRG
ncbi:hypothetical protein [Micromonospora sp. DT4]|uniref:hypothetical protein n=1 Tax=Micromonospora sp. DT4 TaxID=3393438 RepID=UPI003CF046B9